MAFDERLALRVRTALQSRANVSEKKMFAGLAFMLDGKMFCGIVGDDLMVRVGPERYNACLELPHARKMDFTGKPMKGYVFVAPPGRRTAKALQRWIDRGLDFVAGTDAATKTGGPSPAFAETFVKLKRVVSAHAGFLDVQTDSATEYVLTGPMMPRWKKELWFGGVKIGKSYVSLHVMPVYMFPDLLETLSPELRSRMQGKSCFNFKRIEPALLAQVESLIATSIERLRTEGILPMQSTLSRPLHVMDKSVNAALKKRGLMEAFRARPPYQQNDYVGWINRAKRPETKKKRLGQMLDELESGDRYMKMKWRSSARRK